MAATDPCAWDGCHGTRVNGTRYCEMHIAAARTQSRAKAYAMNPYTPPAIRENRDRPALPPRGGWDRSWRDEIDEDAET